MGSKVTRDKTFYAFSPDLQPAARVKQGEDVILETHDCFQGQIRSAQDLVTSLDWSHTNPATGPVYIEGAKPGDILRVDILEIEVADRSVMVTIPGEGALGDVIHQMETTILGREGDHLVYKDKLRIPTRPMIGVVGVAPASGSVPNGTPGEHGGNLDCTLVRQGASLYFTVGVEGALFGAGDVHAAMGDGEIVVVGAETEALVRARAKVVDLQGLPTPFLETDELVATLSSSPDLDEAVAGAIHNMSRFLTELAGVPMNDAAMLMSAVGELRFCQVVDPAKTVRFEFPKWVLNEFGYSLPRHA